jgi:hypothetical protein
MSPKQWCKNSKIIPKGMQSYISSHLSNGKKASKSFLRECRAMFHFTQVIVKSSEVITKGMQSYVSSHLSNGEKALKSFIWECRAMLQFT